MIRDAGEAFEQIGGFTLLWWRFKTLVRELRTLARELQTRVWTDIADFAGRLKFALHTLWPLLT